jgi:hypothetical protein
MVKKQKHSQDQYKDDLAVSQYMGDASETGLTLHDTKKQTGKPQK